MVWKGPNMLCKSFLVQEPANKNSAPDGLRLSVSLSFLGPVLKPLHPNMLQYLAASYLNPGIEPQVLIFLSICMPVSTPCFAHCDVHAELRFEGQVNAHHVQAEAHSAANPHPKRTVSPLKRRCHPEPNTMGLCFPSLEWSTGS